MVLVTSRCIPIGLIRVSSSFENTEATSTSVKGSYLKEIPLTSSSLELNKSVTHCGVCSRVYFYSFVEKQHIHCFYGLGNLGNSRCSLYTAIGFIISLFLGSLLIVWNTILNEEGKNLLLHY